MIAPRSFGPGFRTVTLLAFVLACLTFAGYLYAQAGGSLPGFGRAGRYTASFDTDNVVNLVTYSDVETAGVPVGKVAALSRVSNQVIRVVMTLEDVVTPLHEGVTVQIGEKSLAGQPVVQLVDGTGPAIPDDSVLGAAAVKPAVQLRDVLASLDQPTRDAMGGMIRSLGQATDGRQHDVSALAEGLTAVGANGDTALDAIAAQSNDLAVISQQLRQVFEALDTGRGQIAQLVSTADQLSAATAGQRPALEASVQKLPGVLDSATTASAGISRISQALSPVAADVNVAGPELNDSLDQLPDTSVALRKLLPPLNSVLDDAPDTLRKLPTFGDQARELFPPTSDLLRDLDPMLRYLKPYGLDFAQFFANFGGAIHHYGDDGRAYLPLRATFKAGSVKPDPVKLPDALTTSNPYPAPGGLKDLRPFVGTYPRVQRDGG
jgi:phospholipid/cholesterol/gamma-HCH transport system substrate-binding protein